ncbi:MAG: hypothetical protein HY775_09045 [Acidobacteria bacterium]|nr:hypothetical protein [Acidobacteriota bacterium]
MAIKGRSRRRSRARGPSRAPRPHVAERKVPFVRRPWVRRSAAGALAAAAVLGGLRVWQNVSRSGALRAYDWALQRAQAPMLEHLRPGGATSLDDAPLKFGREEIGGKEFRALAARWEKDFTAARDAVRALTSSKTPPPAPLRRANDLIAQGIDGYIAAARLYTVAAIQRGLAAAERDAKASAKLEAQVQLLLQHADEARRRGDAVYDVGNREIQDYKASWHVEPPLPTPAGAPAPS